MTFDKFSAWHKVTKTSVCSQHLFGNFPVCQQCYNTPHSEHLPVFQVDSSPSFRSPYANYILAFYS